MTPGRPVCATTRRIRARRRRGAGALVAAIVAIAAALWSGSLVSSSVTVPSPSTASPPRSPAPPKARSRGEHRGALGEAGGAVPDRTTAFDDRVPGVAKLDPALLRALRRAATAAAADGVELFVDSGWRSRDYQRHLLEQAVAKYGSQAEAARWVATPGRSAHVTGDAVDVGPADAAAWLSERGAAYGLCRIYANEPWHYELRPNAIDRGCPPPYADPTQDPRMQR